MECANGMNLFDRADFQSGKVIEKMIDFFGSIGSRGNKQEIEVLKNSRILRPKSNNLDFYIEFSKTMRFRLIYGFSKTGIWPADESDAGDNVMLMTL